MPAYTPSTDDMDTESYGGGPVTAPEDTASETESVDQENQTASTALVPNKILSPEGEPLKEGDEIVVRVVKNYGDESEIEYAPKEGGSETSETEEPMSTEGQELAALSQEGA